MSLLNSIKSVVPATRSMIRKYINYLLGDNHDYFTNIYPGNRSFIVRRIMGYLARKIQIDDHNLEKIKNLPENSHVVFASKEKHLFDFLYFHTRLKAEELPHPEIGFDYQFCPFLPIKQLFKIALSQADYFFHNYELKDLYASGLAERELLSGKSGFVSLIEKEDFQNRFIRSGPDPLHHLIELQKKTDDPVIIVPEDTIYVANPMHKEPGLADILFGTHERPGLVKRLFILLRRPEKVKIAVAKPVNLKTFINRSDIQMLDSEFQTHRLRSHLVDILNRQRKSITGPVLKSRQEITEDILNRKSLREFLADYAQRNNISLKKTNKKAAGYINEIAANYNQRIINFGHWILNWIFKNIFDDLMVNQEELNRMREKYAEAPLILVPCHKSHLDYLLLPYIMFENNMPCPHIAAGKNLSFWPLGPLFRRGGAFFLRRTFKGAELYAKIFGGYLEQLLREGFNIKIYIEGGRSRTGKLLPPKPGGLAMMIRAYLDGACDNLYFVPIFVGYDRVLEEDAYLKEIEGGKKSPETLKGLISTRKFLKKKYGKVYVRFDEPISIRDYISDKNIDLKRVGSKEYMNFVKGFGYKLIDSINQKTVATPHGILASAILNCRGNSFSSKQVMVRVNTYMNLLTHHNAELSDTLVMDPDNTLKAVTQTFLSRKFIELIDEDEDEISAETNFVVKQNKRAILDYYKNSVISFFVPSAYTAIAILEIDRFKFSPSDLLRRYKFLQTMFTDEFSFNEDITCEEQISRSLKGFVNEGILVPDTHRPDLFNLTSKGLRKLKWIAAFMAPFFQSYHTTLLYLEKEKKEITDPKERGKKILSFGGKMYKKKQIPSRESVSLINYRNAAAFFEKNGIKSSQDQGEIDHYKQILSRLIRLNQQ
ncbi:MAG: 1-acyl-sn-glycerol-3-phosphate acyltransferase [Desulfobacterales bacterium]|nr:1-acyl-sn-glycerol-3-phosphate acyltransferase [Desulfobacterales bacterium]